MTLLTSSATDIGTLPKIAGHFLLSSISKAKFTIYRHQLLHAWWFPPCLASDLTSFSSLAGLSSLEIAHSSVKTAVNLWAKGWLLGQGLWPLLPPPLVTKTVKQGYNYEAAITSFVTVLSLSNFNIHSSSYELSKFCHFWQNVIKSCISGRLITK